MAGVFAREDEPRKNGDEKTHSHWDRARQVDMKLAVETWGQAKRAVRRGR